MFIRYYLDLAIPFEDVESALLTQPDAWVPGLALAADDHGERLLVEVGFAVDDEHRVDKQVQVEFGEPYRIPNKAALPMSWEATGRDRLFPALDADLEVAALGPNRTQLSISARYRPPMGPLGRALDKALLHRVAEATVKDFLDRVGEALQARAVATG
jgi:hypothetical protein